MPGANGRYHVAGVELEIGNDADAHQMDLIVD